VGELHSGIFALEYRHLAVMLLGFRVTSHLSDFFKTSSERMPIVLYSLASAFITFNPALNMKARIIAPNAMHLPWCLNEKIWQYRYSIPGF
jgi:hypothetical protein